MAAGLLCPGVRGLGNRRALAHQPRVSGLYRLVLGLHRDVYDVVLREHLGPVGVLAAGPAEGLACKWTKTAP